MFVLPEIYHFHTLKCHAAGTRVTAIRFKRSGRYFDCFTTVFNTGYYQKKIQDSTSKIIRRMSFYFFFHENISVLLKAFAVWFVLRLITTLSTSLNS